MVVGDLQLMPMPTAVMRDMPNQVLSFEPNIDDQQVVDDSLAAPSDDDSVGLVVVSYSSPCSPALAVPGLEGLSSQPRGSVAVLEVLEGPMAMTTAAEAVLEPVLDAGCVESMAELAAMGTVVGRRSPLVPHRVRANSHARTSPATALRRSKRLEVEAVEGGRTPSVAKKAEQHITGLNLESGLSPDRPPPFSFFALEYIPLAHLAEVATDSSIVFRVVKGILLKHIEAIKAMEVLAG